MERKMFFFDLDGTTLSDDSMIPQDNIDAIGEMLDLGHCVAVATGRAYVSAIPVIEKLGILRKDCYMIGYNGGVIYDLENGRILKRQLVPDEYASYLFSEAERAGLYIQAYDDDGFLTARECPESDFYQKKTSTPYRIVPDLYQRNVYHTPKVLLLAIEDQKPLYDFQDRHKDWEKGKCLSCFSFPEMLEYMNLNASKGLGIEFFTDYLGISPQNTIAIGDADNDISMIRAAGIGVAMKNASDHVKESADYVTKCTNNEAGMAEALRRFA